MTLHSLSRRKVVFLRVRTVNEDITQVSVKVESLRLCLRHKFTRR